MSPWHGPVKIANSLLTLEKFDLVETIRNFVNVINDLPHTDERLKSASQSTRDRDAALHTIPSGAGRRSALPNGNLTESSVKGFPN